MISLLLAAVLSQAQAAAVRADTTAMHYGLGWVDQTFRDGRHLLWHSGGIDGAGSLMGFLPSFEKTNT